MREKSNYTIIVGRPRSQVVLSVLPTKTAGNGQKVHLATAATVFRFVRGCFGMAYRSTHPVQVVCIPGEQGANSLLPVGCFSDRLPKSRRANSIANCNL